MVKRDSTPVSTPKPASDDPLAAMMAPPSKTRLTTPNSALRGPPRIPRSHDPSMGTNAPPSSAKPVASPAAPPQFVIFQPKSAEPSEEEK